jgi:Na+/melibiose symporter-like transporter
MLHFFIRLIEIIFLVGLAGSLVVAIMAFVGDIHEFFEKDRSEGPNQAIGD